MANDINDEQKSESNSPTKRASNRKKLEKEKEETLKMYEDSCKKCDDEVDALIENLEHTVKQECRNNTACTNDENKKSQSLTDILNDLNNFKAPATELTDERKSESTSPAKRASNRKKLEKEKEETLKMYEESCKKSDDVVDALIENLEEASAPKSSSTDMATSTETVWIRTKAKAKVLPATVANVQNSTPVPANTRDSAPAKSLSSIPVSTNAEVPSTAATTSTNVATKKTIPATGPSITPATVTTSVEQSKRRTIRLADEQVRQIASKGPVRPNFLGDKRGTSTVRNESNKKKGY